MTRIRIIVALAVFATAGAAGFTGVPSSLLNANTATKRGLPGLPGPPGLQEGINAHLLNSDSGVVGPLLDAAASGSLTWIRVDVDLVGTPSRGTLNAGQVRAMDRIVTEAASRGIKVMFTLKNTPRWAGDNADAPWSDPTQFGEIAGLMAAQFRGRVGAWELWNEPNIDTFLRPPDPVKYTAMVRAAYPAIKAADRGVAVVVSDTSYVDTNFVSAEYAAGLHGNFDVMGVHPYNMERPPNQQGDYSSTRRGVLQLPSLYGLMAAHGDGNKPVWATEWGFSSYSVGPMNQAHYDIAELQAFVASYPFVKASFVYQSREQTTDDQRSNDLGVLTGGLVVKPAYNFVKFYATVCRLRPLLHC
jgi:hypothetical protein